jgi:hypothetical protein
MGVKEPTLLSREEVEKMKCNRQTQEVSCIVGKKMEPPLSPFWMGVSCPADPSLACILCLQKQHRYVRLFCMFTLDLSSGDLKLP